MTTDLLSQPPALVPPQWRERVESVLKRNFLVISPYGDGPASYGRGPRRIAPWENASQNHISL
jgi:hypothetical protein